MIYQLDDRIPSLPDDYFVADSATVIGDVTLHNNANIWFGAVLRGDIEPIVIGEGSNIQDNAVVHTSAGYPVKLGRNVSVGHKVSLHGCTIGDHCLIGMDASLLDGCVIGENCLIGAKSLVKQHQIIPPNSLVVGSPARVVRCLSDEECAEIKDVGRRYVIRFKHYLSGALKPIE